jgi:Uma2 family endonuclease
MVATFDAQPRRFTADEYERMAEAGVFVGQERVELLAGIISEMSPEGRTHVVAIELAREVLSTKIGQRAGMRIRHPLRVADDAVPEPDIAIVEQSDPRAYLNEHPKTALLVIEVSHHSLQRDLDFKSALYAEAGVREYWVENLVNDEIAVFREPASGAYQSRETFRSGDTVSLIAFPDVHIRVDDLIP